nr:DegV family EDD domain-containing protein [Lachnospiraceae bacterium]
MNLSTGIGLQVIRAAEYAASRVPASEIVKRIEDARVDVRASFVIDTLTYLARGGRCSSVTALLANTLKLHPIIGVKDGAMDVVKKLRGNIGHAIMTYVRSMEADLKKADPSRVFITHSGCSPEIVNEVRDYLKGLGHFDEVIETRAGGVISSHCGPNTLGVLFYSK